ncbi:NitT/TauT family transport system substrate-binding protein [Actinoplanes lutulentus]|uniref:NitT/TauT family transport system substrate-binding protein n=1 Tax=Actinoplanes lutulentus TaxID=1287878 RepID=A0A327ZF00_9ACTN|nr:ABC transporter substrate-binding protein [Actinoplanes lutulentus]MBB2946256.1 NitT/TauT family transport system substrate-binding protein [Actinoplanes lutulentus]RAK32943.1 NitT/TauT family transport system substrate-binding protein [Actinoplanes lutulentus]
MRIVAAVLTTLALVGCSSSAPDSSADLTEVKYLTAFNAFGREAYAFVADEKGYFAEQGLDVEISIGTGSGENMAALASGAADFAPVDSTGYILTKATGKVTGITAVSAVQQKSMVGFMTLDGYGITTPKDLEGRVMGDQSGATTTLLFPTYAKLAGIDASKVEIVPVNAGELAGALAAKKVDVIGQFVVGKPLIEKAAGGKAAISLPFSDVITDLYGNVLLTSEKTDPALSAKFNTALIKGLEYAITNPVEAGQILNKAQPETDAAVAAKELEIMAPYARGEGAKLGEIDNERVSRVIEILTDAGSIPAGKKPAEFIQPVA